MITAAELPHADGLIFGTPTRFGTPSAQFKAFLDSTGGLWQSVGGNSRSSSGRSGGATLV